MEVARCSQISRHCGHDESQTAGHKYSPVSEITSNQSSLQYDITALNDLLGNRESTPIYLVDFVYLAIGGRTYCSAGSSKRSKIYFLKKEGIMTLKFSHIVKTYLGADHIPRYQLNSLVNATLLHLDTKDCLVHLCRLVPSTRRFFCSPCPQTLNLKMHIIPPVSTYCFT